MSDDIAVRLTEDGPARIRGNGRTWIRGETRNVSPDKADALLEAHDFMEIVDEATEGSDGDESSDESGDEGESVALEDLTHDELKARAEERGIADEIDLRNKDSIIEALED